uniref:Uncharacterized protein n=1 Tax=Arundo donax TaxID=35708 RepID=A0A0A9H1U8_ARUDO
MLKKEQQAALRSSVAIIPDKQGHGCFSQAPSRIV